MQPTRAAGSRRRQKKSNSLCIVLLMCAVLMACNKISSPEDYVHWVNSEDNGLTNTKYVNGLRLTVKYLPSEYMAYQELKNLGKYSAGCRDSIVGMYRKNLYFLLTLAPDERKAAGGDVVMDNTRSYSDYVDKVMMMNFAIEHYIAIVVDGRKIRPILATVENTYGLTRYRNIVCVFDRRNNALLQSADSYDFEFNDELFMTGISHFIFHKQDIDDIPQMTFL